MIGALAITSSMQAKHASHALAIHITGVPHGFAFGPPVLIMHA